MNKGKTQISFKAEGKPNLIAKYTHETLCKHGYERHIENDSCIFYTKTNMASVKYNVEVFMKGTDVTYFAYLGDKENPIDLTGQTQSVDKESLKNEINVIINEVKAILANDENTASNTTDNNKVEQTPVTQNKTPIQTNSNSALNNNVQNNNVQNNNVQNNNVQNNNVMQNNNMQNNGYMQNNNMQNNGYMQNNNNMQNNPYMQNNNMQNNMQNNGYMQNNMQNNNMQNNGYMQNNMQNNGYMQNNNMHIGASAPMNAKAGNPKNATIAMVLAIIFTIVPLIKIDFGKGFVLSLKIGLLGMAIVFVLASKALDTEKRGLAKAAIVVGIIAAILNIVLMFVDYGIIIQV